MVTQRIMCTNYGHAYGAGQVWCEKTMQTPHSLTWKFQQLDMSINPVSKKNSCRISLFADILIEWAASCLEELYLVMLKLPSNWTTWNHSCQVDYTCQVNCACQVDCRDVRISYETECSTNEEFLRDLESDYLFCDFCW